MHHLAEPVPIGHPTPGVSHSLEPDPCDNPPCQSSIVVEDADLSSAVAISDPEKVSSNPSLVARRRLDRLHLSKPRGGRPRQPRPCRSCGPTDGICESSLRQRSSPTASHGAPTEPRLPSRRPTQGLGVAGGLTEIGISDGVLRPVALAGGVDGYDWQAVASDRSMLPLPIAGSPASVAP